MTKKKTRLEMISIDKIREVSNIRESVGDVRGLARSIEAVGLLNPLTVIEEAEGTYRLVAGHRRLAAVRSLGSSEIPVYVTGWISENYDEIIATQLVENLEREDLDPLEEAEALADLVEILGTQKAAADAIGRSPAHLSKRLKIRQLPDEAKSAVRAGTVTLEDAFEMTKLPEKAAAKIAKISGSDPEKASRELRSELTSHQRDEESRKAARAVAGQDHRKGITVVARPDMPDSWKSLEGWNGIAVDQDLHEKEACHRLVVGYSSNWDQSLREEFFCADPERHGPEGDSDNKITDPHAKSEEEEAKRKAERERIETARAEKRAKLLREAIDLSAGLNRNDAVKILSRWLLGDLETGQLAELLKLFGVEVPEAPETQPWTDPDTWNAYGEEITALLSTAPDSKLYRAAVLYVLTITTHAGQLWVREDPKNQPLAEILGIEIDREEVK